MRYLFVSLLFFVFQAGFVHAQKITVATESFEPYNFKENGKIIGMSTEIVRATLEQAGIEATIREYPWPRAYKMALEQENVLIFSIGRTGERENLFKWIGPIAPPVKLGLFKLEKRRDIVLQSLEDAWKYTTGVMKDNGDHHFLRSRGFEDGKHLDVVTRMELNVRKLFAGRIDLLATSEWWLPKNVGQVGHKPGEVEMAYLFMELELYMAFSKTTSDDIVDRVKTAFEKIKAKELLKKVEKKYQEKYGL